MSVTRISFLLVGFTSFCGYVSLPARAQAQVIIYENSESESVKTSHVSPARSLIRKESTKQPAAIQTTPSLVTTKEDNLEVERITDRYPDGKVFCDRSVTLDQEGNYINHGDYREIAPNGEVITSGSFEMGKREGVWFKRISSNDSKLFAAVPFNKFKPPFVSTATFKNDVLNGVWTIVDKDNRIVCHIELMDGVRNGPTTVYHPNGQVFSQAEYDRGVLNGKYLEKRTDSANIQEYEYANGHRTEVVTERYPNNNVMSVFTYLSAPVETVSNDDWISTKLAVYSFSKGSRQLHGEFTTFHDNGKISAKGKYEHDVLVGRFESWHKNGEIDVVGEYDRGKQNGEWVWRYSNGMKKSVAIYASGELVSQPKAWDESGKLVKHQAENSEELGQKRTAVRAVKSSIIR